MSLLRPSDVAFGIKGSEIADAAVQLLGQTLPLRRFSAADVDRLVRAVVTREHQTPTLCGAIAIPHARDPELTEIVAAVGVNPEGAIPGPNAPRIVISFISPERQRAEHLALLSSIARLSCDQAAIEAISSAASAQAVLNVLATHSK